MTDKLYLGATAHVNYQPNTCMQTQLLKKLSVLSCLGLALFGVNHRAAGQLLVGPSGLATQTFDVAPPVADWSTRSSGPAVAGGVIASGPHLDNAVQTNTAASVNAVLPTTTVVPPAVLGTAQWNSTGDYLQTRPNGNWYTLLMATLRNTTASNIAFISIRYDLGALAAAGSSIGEEVPAHRAYYSFTGAADSWVRIPGLDSPGANDSGLKTAMVPLGNWAPNATLYLLWADANSSAAFAGSIQEGGYTIDNFAVSAVPPQTGVPVITSQPQSRSVGFPNTVVFSVSAIGTTPLSYQWFKDGAVIPGATSPTYGINNATLADQGSYHVVVSNSVGTTASSPATLTITGCSATAPAITSQPSDLSTNAGGTITLSVTASGTGLTYQWFRSGFLLGTGTGPTFSKANAQSGDSGLYTVVIKNCAGAVTSRQVVVSVADQPYILMPLTNHVWKYEQSGTDLGTAWRAVNYNDAAWPSGLGLFAFEDNTTILGLTRTTLNHFNPDFITRYFRTTFVLTNDPATLTLISSNYLDDGIIVYVNGVEAFRVNMPGGAVNFTTPASAGATEAVAVVSNLPPSLLVEGTNVVAVELHQVNATSSDSVFGMAIIARLFAPTILAITNEPESLVVEETKPATFTVGVQGQPVFYQWYKDGVPILNADTNPFTIPITFVTNAGTYFVVAFNAVNAVTSGVVALTILTDTNPPTLVEADGTLSATNVLVTFSERVLLSTATNLANYKITNTLGGTNQIFSAVLTNGTNVLLRTAARAENNNYILIVNNVRDISPLTNAIAPNSRIPISWQLTPIPLVGGDWRYYFDFGADYPGTNWQAINFDDSGNAGWGAGGAGLAYFGGDESGDLSFPIQTALSWGPITYYFRQPFNLTASPGGARAFLRHGVDDGAKFYFNGPEVLRYNMPVDLFEWLNGGATPSTLALVDIPRAILVDPVEIPVSTLLRYGTNVLAAEVHISGAEDNEFLDVVFAAELVLKVQSFVVGPVIITGGPHNVTGVEGQPVTFAVDQVGGSRFQWKQVVGGVTNNIAGATNASYTIPSPLLSMDGMQFFVTVSNATSGAISTNATLRMTPEKAGPALLGAILATNGTVVVSFSEPVSATATVPSNYRITNSTGGSISISGAVLANNNSNVILTVGAVSGSGLRLVVSNVQDRAAAPNTIFPNPSIATIGYIGPVPLFPISGSWKYEQTGTDLGTAWRAVGYNDTPWPSGPALLGLEPGGTAEPIRTPLVLSNGTAPQVITYYFRTTFTSPAGGLGRLRLRMELDDGAVFYLNGAEFFRLRIGAAVNPVLYATLGANPPAEGVFETFEVTVTNLLSGTNLLAVEVHQSGTTSSDVVFGTDVTLLSVETTVVPPEAVRIVTPPQSRTNGVGSAASFTVVAAGSGPLYYQWLRSGTNIPNATNSTFNIPSVQLSDAGIYAVRVTNAISTATSAGATLTVTNAGQPCSPITWATNLRFATNGSNWVSATRVGNVTTTVLSWTNPATNTCGSNAVVVLQRALTLGNVYPIPSTLWTNIYTNVFGYARVTNSVTNSNEAYYRLRVQ